MSTTDDKKYVSMEAVLQAINKSYISLAEDQVKRNNPIIKQIIEQNLIPKMKQLNPLFELLYSTIYYGGSYYDGLKVGRPEEYDLDLLMSLPKYGNPLFIESDSAGYVYVQLPLLEKVKKQPEGPKYNGLEKLMDDDNFILTTKFRSWVEGLIQKALNSFDKEDNKSAVVVIEEKGVSTKFHIDTAKSGPAFTLKITGVVNNETIEMNVDVVPALKCSKWPESSDYRQNPFPHNKTDFFVVPKGPTREASTEKYWRLSFQDQERTLINGCNKMKPVIRLLKRLRDFQKHDLIASYYIKSIFLLTIDDEQLRRSWTSDSLSSCFMKGLELYETHLRKHSIPFYWNRNNNLLSNVKEDTCTGYANKIRKIINQINIRIDVDPFVVSKYLLSQDDIDGLKSSVNLGGKVEKRLFTSQLLHSASNSSINTSVSESTTSSKSAVMLNPLERLNYELHQHSFDAVDGVCMSENNSGNETLGEILKELRLINSRLSKIEEKIDDLTERQNRLEKKELNMELINSSFANLNMVGSVLSNL